MNLADQWTVLLITHGIKLCTNAVEILLPYASSWFENSGFQLIQIKAKKTKTS